MTTSDYSKRFSNDIFTEKLNVDCRTFVQYVADAGFQPAILTNTNPLIFASALHIEMDLWMPGKPHLNRRKYRINDAEHNAWQAMQQMGIANKFTPREIAQVFALIRNTFPTLHSGQSAITIFDSWHTNLLQELRSCGLGKIGAIGSNPNSKPTTLATLGLAQKVVNIYLKYASCWAIVGRYQTGNFITHNLIDNILDFTCALHAPIDAILMKELRKRPYGIAWIKEGFLDRNQSRLKQINGAFTPWSKLDCAETYQKFQDKFRSVATSTWLSNRSNTAKTSIPDHSISDSAIINPAAKIISTTTNYSKNISTQKTDIFLNGIPADFYGIKENRLQRNNPIGCLEIKPNNQNPDGTLCLKFHAMEIIAEHGGNFQSFSGYTATDGATRRCTGSGYVGWQEFGTMMKAINYLQQYFNVRACDTETQSRLIQHGVFDIPL